MSSSPQPTTIVYALRRRWYLTLLGLILGAGVVATTLIVTPVTYTAQADVLLIPPTGAEAGANPLLDLGGLEDVPVTVSRSVFSDAAVASLARQGITSGYGVTTDFTTPAPILLVTGSGKTPAQAVAAMNAVIKLIPLTLTQLQDVAKVSARARITTSVLPAGQKAQPVTRTRTRLIFIAALIALLLTIALPVGVERFSRRRTATDAIPAVEPDTTLDAAHPAEIYGETGGSDRDHAGSLRDGSTAVVHNGANYAGHNHNGGYNGGSYSRIAFDGGPSEDGVGDGRRSTSNGRRRAARHAAADESAGEASRTTRASAPSLAAQHANTPKIGDRRQHAAPQRHDPAPTHPTPSNGGRSRTPRPGQSGKRP